jgi:large subunit ribosomal protein L32
MAVPKRRISSTRRDKRRAHDALNSTAPSTCSSCKQPKLSHRVCPSCGQYGGEEIIQIED